MELAKSAGSTLVSVLASSAWETARSAVAGLWRRVHPDRVEAVEGELLEAREELVGASDADRAAVEQDVTTDWQRRFRRLLAADPTIVVELRRILDEELAPAAGTVSAQAGGVAVGGNAAVSAFNGSVAGLGVNTGGGDITLGNPSRPESTRP